MKGHDRLQKCTRAEPAATHDQPTAAAAQRAAKSQRLQSRFAARAIRSCHMMGLLLRRPWLLMSAACLVPAVLDVLQSYVQGRIDPQNASPWRWMIWGGFEWIILGALIPITFFLGRRYPLRHPNLGKHIAIHLAGAMILCVGWSGMGLVVGALL
ncbi:MAG: hypothetical protein ACRENH_02235, partial [Gemmatimonadaceae bacterium]